MTPRIGWACSSFGQCRAGGGRRASASAAPTRLGCLWLRSAALQAHNPPAFRDTIFFKIYASARKHGAKDEDIFHAVDYAVVAGEQDDGKVLYLGPDRAGNMLEVVSVMRDDGSEIAIHAMRMRAKYEPFLRGEGESNA